MSSCNTELNTLEPQEGCPNEVELMLFIAPSGYSGYSGYALRSWLDLKACLSGYSGYSGRSGASGVSGASGESGYSGYSGRSGYSGYSGVSGYSGDNPGSSGFSGFSGQSGDNPGSSGFSGFSGASGDNPGSSGFSGYSGYSGGIGSTGVSGFSGYSGITPDVENNWKTVTSSSYTTQNVGAGQTTYAQITGNTTFQAEANKTYIISEDCKAKNLFIRTTSSQPSTGNLVITLRLNFTNTALQITLPINSLAGTYSNISDEVDIVAGDVLTLQFQNNASINSATILTTGFTLIRQTP